jgi:hypothetical protein
MTRFSFAFVIAACAAPAVPVLANPKPPPTPAPTGFEWVDRQGDLALARGTTEEERQTCEVWNIRTHRRIAELTGEGVSAGGSTPDCIKLSPRGTLVEWANSRRRVWKNLANQVTSCRGVVAPDDASCIEDDVSPFMFNGKDGEPADLQLSWTKPAVDAMATVVATIPRGLNRNSPSERWWTVKYCSADKAVIDIRGGDRIVVDANTGAATVTHPRAGEPACN